MSRVYDEIVSLGVGCRVTYNLRRTFGIRHAFPFDWWVTPLPALVAFLDDPSLDRLYDPQHLKPVWKDGERFAIRNVHYDIELHHEFPRRPDGFVGEDWLDHLDQPRARTAHVWNRFNALPATARKVLFVREFIKSDRTRPPGQTTALTAAVMAALERRLPGLDFGLLLIDSPEKVALPKVAHVKIGDRNTDDFRGTPDLWTERLLGTGFSRTDSADRLDTETLPERDQLAYV